MRINCTPTRVHPKNVKYESLDLRVISMLSWYKGTVGVLSVLLRINERVRGKAFMQWMPIHLPIIEVNVDAP